MNIGDRDTFRAASALAGGVARQGETCGAVIGALSALGLISGREQIEDVTAFRRSMDLAMKLRGRFLSEMQEQFGLSAPLENTLCRHIQTAIFGRSFDLTRSEEFQAFLDAGGHEDKGCPMVCGVAAEVAVDELSRYA